MVVQVCTPFQELGDEWGQRMTVVSVVRVEVGLLGDGYWCAR